MACPGTRVCCFCTLTSCTTVAGGSQCWCSVQFFSALSCSVQLSGGVHDRAQSGQGKGCKMLYQGSGTVALLAVHSTCLHA